MAIKTAFGAFGTEKFGNKTQRLLHQKFRKIVKFSIKDANIIFMITKEDSNLESYGNMKNRIQNARKAQIKRKYVVMLNTYKNSRH